MTTDEIIDCLETTGLNQEFVCQFYEEMKLFAKLVAQKEREACIKIVMQGTGEPIQRKTLDILHQERTRIALAIKGQE